MKKLNKKQETLIHAIKLANLNRTQHQQTDYKRILDLLNDQKDNYLELFLSINPEYYSKELRLQNGAAKPFKDFIRKKFHTENFDSKSVSLILKATFNDLEGGTENKTAQALKRLWKNKDSKEFVTYILKFMQHKELIDLYFFINYEETVAKIASRWSTVLLQFSMNKIIETKKQDHDNKKTT